MGKHILPGTFSSGTELVCEGLLSSQLNQEIRTKVPIYVSTFNNREHLALSYQSYMTSFSHQSEELTKATIKIRGMHRHLTSQLTSLVLRQGLPSNLSLFFQRLSSILTALHFKVHDKKEAGKKWMAATRGQNWLSPAPFKLCNHTHTHKK